MHRILLAWIICSFAFPSVTFADNKGPAGFVDPFIGTAAENESYSGNTYPGAQVPWGMVSVSPETRANYPGGYGHGDPSILGFGHIHRSGGGCADLGNILLMPTQGTVKTTDTDYRSAYKNELAEPGFYQVDLIEPTVTAAMTATPRVGVSRYTFEKEVQDPKILLDVTHSIPGNPESGEVTIVSDQAVEGSVKTGSHCGSPNDQPLYFSAEFSEPAIETGTWIDTTVTRSSTQKGKNIGAYFAFHGSRATPIIVKVGFSYVSTANAHLNLQNEVPDFDFDKIHQNALTNWNQELNKIEVEGGTKEQKTIFYTGLYHMLLQPSVMSDVNGEYPEAQGSGIKKADGFTRYTIFPMWDQFRTVYPLLTLVYPDRMQDMIKSALAIYEETGWLPKWELLGWDNRGMIGDHAAAFIVGAYMKGIRDFDVETAYEALKKGATQIPSETRPILKEYQEKGYIPESLSAKSEGASTTIEYSYDDWLIGKLANALGKKSDAEFFIKRSNNYKNVYDEITKLARPRLPNGSFLTPFDPASGPAFPGAQGFAEGNSWNYSFFPVQHIENDGLIAFMGGADAFIKKLSENFQAGHYSLVNEPDSATPYLYTYVAGHASDTQAQVRKDMAEKFNSTPKGLPGNDDEGSLSGVFVFDALGFFPADPGSDAWQIGSPLFDRVTIHLNPKFSEGKTFTIETKNNDVDHPYIQRASLNNTNFDCTSFSQADLTKGGTLIFAMGAQPTSWGKPPSLCTDSTPQTVPTSPLSRNGVLALGMVGVLTLAALLAKKYLQTKHL